MCVVFIDFMILEIVKFNCSYYKINTVQIFGAMVGKGSFDKVWFNSFWIHALCQCFIIAFKSNDAVILVVDFSTGEKWRTRRKLLTPTFHFRILQDFLEVFNEQSQTMVERLRTKVYGKPFDVFPYITNCALDIICGKFF